MGKIHGLGNHGVTGKIGAFVYAKGLGGETVVRNYTAQVKNPKTLRQRTSRLRMATASQVAAMVSPAIAIGFAKAVAGMKMYARNLFVRDIINPGTGAPITITDEVATVDYTKLALSKQAGIAEVLAMQTPTYDEPRTVSVSWTPATISEDLGEGSLGAVIVVVNPSKKGCVVNQSLASAGTADIRVPNNWVGDTVYVYGFHKWIPATGNDIATATQPWKYPSATSGCTYAGTGIVA